MQESCQRATGRNFVLPGLASGLSARQSRRTDNGIREHLGKATPSEGGKGGAIRRPQASSTDQGMDSGLWTAGLLRLGFGSDKPRINRRAH